MVLLKGQNVSFVEVHILGYDNPRAKRDKWTINLLRVSLSVGCDDGTQGSVQTYFLASEIQDLIDWLTSIRYHTRKDVRFTHYYSRVWFESSDHVGELLTLRVHFDFPGGKGSHLPEKREDPYEWWGEFDLALTPSQLEDAIQSLTHEAAPFPPRTPRKK